MPSKITAPRGTQDLIPPQSARWQELEARIHALAHRFGYGEIRTPLFESTDLFVRGVGDTTDIVEKEMYTFADKGGRSLTLRPEWTASVMRAALQHNVFESGAQRLYYIGPIFRYERPQAGRYRQSHQFGVESVGFAGPEADAEVIALADELLRSYALPGITLHLNSIGDAACRPAYREALLAHFRPHADALSADSQRRLERNPLRLLDSKAAQDRTFVGTAPSFEDHLCDSCAQHFARVKAYLDETGIAYAIDPHVVRGLDYYTRTVFEFVSDSLGSQSTVCAGGRYDDLVRSLGGPDVPAVGFALGMERLLLTIEVAGESREAARAGVQAVALGDAALRRIVPVVADLRRRLKTPVFVDFGDRKLLTQLKLADRNNARFALILGSAELEAGSAVVRDLQARTDRAVPLDADLANAFVEEGR